MIQRVCFHGEQAFVNWCVLFQVGQRQKKWPVCTVKLKAVSWCNSTKLAAWMENFGEDLVTDHTHSLVEAVKFPLMVYLPWFYLQSINYTGWPQKSDDVLYMSKKISHCYNKSDHLHPNRSDSLIPHGILRPDRRKLWIFIGRWLAVGCRSGFSTYCLLKICITSTKEVIFPWHWLSCWQKSFHKSHPASSLSLFYLPCVTWARGPSDFIRMGGPRVQKSVTLFLLISDIIPYCHTEQLTSKRWNLISTGWCRYFGPLPVIKAPWEQMSRSTPWSVPLLNHLLSPQRGPVGISLFHCEEINRYKQKLHSKDSCFLPQHADRAQAPPRMPRSTFFIHGYHRLLCKHGESLQMCCLMSALSYEPCARPSPTFEIRTGRHCKAALRTPTSWITLNI